MYRRKRGEKPPKKKGPKPEGPGAGFLKRRMLGVQKGRRNLRVEPGTKTKKNKTSEIAIKGYEKTSGKKRSVSKGQKGETGEKKKGGRKKKKKFSGD